MYVRVRVRVQARVSTPECACGEQGCPAAGSGSPQCYWGAACGPRAATASRAQQRPALRHMRRVVSLLLSWLIMPCLSYQTAESFSQVSDACLGLP